MEIEKKRDYRGHVMCWQDLEGPVFFTAGINCHGPKHLLGDNYCHVGYCDHSHWGRTSDRFLRW
ncbi:hypothetical protein C5167_037059 [Papaver somniferum]|uniref:Uncharacterized protein n=1 Tax=Papaver somniferum TaxID=3469 RepID=A0A4Y7I5N2_PAPSO|nr:hypothetical protein C5167_037059 [Papaver somniferum]